MSIQPYARNPAAVGTPTVGPGNSPELGNIGSNGSGSARRTSGALEAAGLGTISGASDASGATVANGSTVAAGAAEAGGATGVEGATCARAISGKTTHARKTAPVARRRIESSNITLSHYDPLTR